MANLFRRTQRPGKNSGFLSDLMSHIRSLIPHPNAFSTGGSGGGGGGGDVSLAQVTELINNHNINSDAHRARLSIYATQTALSLHMGNSDPHSGVLAKKVHTHTASEITDLANILSQYSNGGGGPVISESGETFLPEKTFSAAREWNSLVDPGSYYIKAPNDATSIDNDDGLYPCFAKVEAFVKSSQPAILNILIEITDSTQNGQVGANKINGDYELLIMYPRDGIVTRGNGVVYQRQQDGPDIYQVRWNIDANRWEIVRFVGGDIDEDNGIVVVFCAENGQSAESLPAEGSTWMISRDAYVAVGGSDPTSISVRYVTGDSRDKTLGVHQIYTYFDTEDRVLKRERYFEIKLEFNDVDAWVARSNNTPHWAVLFDYRT